MKKLLFIFAFVMMASFSFSQEYDDMYYNKKDRVYVNSKHVNPEYIVRYESKPKTIITIQSFHRPYVYYDWMFGFNHFSWYYGYPFYYDSFFFRHPYYSYNYGYWYYPHSFYYPYNYYYGGLYVNTYKRTVNHQYYTQTHINNQKRTVTRSEVRTTSDRINTIQRERVNSFRSQTQRNTSTYQRQSRSNTPSFRPSNTPSFTPSRSNTPNRTYSQPTYQRQSRSVTPSIVPSVTPSRGSIPNRSGGRN